MFKISHNCTHFTCQQGNTQNPPSQASTVHEPRTSRCISWIQKRQESEIKLPTSIGSQKKLEKSRKRSASLTMLKPLTVWITTNWKILKEMELPDHLTCLLRNVYAAKKQQLELEMEQQTGSKSGKEYIKTVYCHPAYLSN